MTPLASLHGRINLEAPGAPAPIIDAVLIEAAQDLLRGTRMWRDEMAAVTLPTGTDRTVSVTAPYDAVLVEPVELKIDGVTLDKDRYRVSANNELALADDVPAGTLTGTMAYEPTEDAVELPDLVVREAREALIFGTLGRLMRMPGVPWMNRESAGYYLTMYDELKSSLEHRTVDGFVKGRPRAVRYGGY